MTKKFISENGFYELDYPETYSLIYEENVLNVFPPDNKSALTVSSYYFGQGVDDERFKQMFELATEDYSPKGDRQELSENVWTQQFSKNTDDELVNWTFWLNRSRNTLILVTLNYGEEEPKERIEDYLRIVGSIKNNGIEIK